MHSDLALALSYIALSNGPRQHGASRAQAVFGKILRPIIGGTMYGDPAIVAARYKAAQTARATMER